MPPSSVSASTRSPRWPGRLSEKKHVTPRSGAPPCTGVSSCWLEFSWDMSSAPARAGSENCSRGWSKLRPRDVGRFLASSAGNCAAAFRCSAWWKGPWIAARDGRAEGVARRGSTGRRPHGSVRGRVVIGRRRSRISQEIERRRSPRHRGLVTVCVCVCWTPREISRCTPFCAAALSSAATGGGTSPSAGSTATRRCRRGDPGGAGAVRAAGTARRAAAAVGDAGHLRRRGGGARAQRLPRVGAVHARAPGRARRARARAAATLARAMLHIDHDLFELRCVQRTAAVLEHARGAGNVSAEPSRRARRRARSRASPKAARRSSTRRRRSAAARRRPRCTPRSSRRTARRARSTTPSRTTAASRPRPAAARRPACCRSR